MSTDHAVRASDDLMGALLGDKPTAIPPNMPVPAAYRLTARQAAFLRVAVRSEAGGKCFVRDWLKACFDDDVLWDTPVTMPEWKQWLDQDGFHAAFYGGFPLGREVSEEDLRGLDVLFWDSLRNGVASGNVRALELHAKVRGLAKNEEGGTTIAIQNILGDTNSNKWRRPRSKQIEGESK